jgi:group I intron endonuclease
MNLNSGIYIIRNIINNNIYIGQSSNLNKRKFSHFYELRKNIHANTHLQNSFKKYNEKNFIFEIILYCEVKELTYYEQSLVDIWNPEYNICKECVTSCLGVGRTDETKRKISIGNKGKILSEDSKHNIKISQRERRIRPFKRTDFIMMKGLLDNGYSNLHIVLEYNIPFITAEKIRNGFYNNAYGIKYNIPNYIEDIENYQQ